MCCWSACKGKVSQCVHHIFGARATAQLHLRKTAQEHKLGRCTLPQACFPRRAACPRRLECGHWPLPGAAQCWWCCCTLTHAQSTAHGPRVTQPVSASLPCDGTRFLYQCCGCCHSEGEVQHVLVSGVCSNCRSAWPRCLPDWSTGSGSVEVGVVLSGVHLTQELPALDAQQCFVDADFWWLQAHIILGCRPAIISEFKLSLSWISYRDSQCRLHVSE